MALPLPPSVPVGRTRIFVQTESGKTFTMDCDAIATFHHIRGWIHQLEGIPPDKLEFAINGKNVEDGRRGDWNVPAWMVRCWISNPRCGWPEGGYVVGVNPSDTIDEVKAKIQDNEGIPLNVQRFSVRESPNIALRAARALSVIQALQASSGAYVRNDAAASSNG
jgi:ubiquitin C